MFAPHPHDDLTHEVVRLRVPTPGNLLEDLEHLKSGVLDHESFVNGYRFMAHPFELIHRDAAGELLSIRRGHNMRTNKGGQLEGGQISGTAATATAQWLALSSTLDTSGSNGMLPADTVLAGELVTGGASGVSIGGGTTGGPRVQAGTGTGSTLTTGAAVGSSSTVNTTNQYKNVLQATFQWNGASGQAVKGVGVYDASAAGNLWFEFAFALISLNTSDTLQLTYTVNY